MEVFIFIQDSIKKNLKTIEERKVSCGSLGSVLLSTPCPYNSQQLKLSAHITPTNASHLKILRQKNNLFKTFTISVHNWQVSYNSVEIQVSLVFESPSYAIFLNYILQIYIG